VSDVLYDEQRLSSAAAAWVLLRLAVMAEGLVS
jgi:hypothetical protein